MAIATKTATIVYLAALGAVLYLLSAFWKSRRNWREFIAREDLALFVSVAMVCNLCLAQFNYTNAYWAPAWPFAVAIVCQMICRFLRMERDRRLLWWGALAMVLVLHCSYLPARTYLWYRLGFVNMRAQLRNFAATLPQGGRMFIPEVFWDTLEGDDHRLIYMNAIPALLGEAEQKKYAAYIEALMRRGDVLVTDSFQWTPTLIDLRPPGWRQIGRCSDVYGGTNVTHGFALIAYQKQ